jgi:hypothetical protein
MSRSHGHAHHLGYPVLHRHAPHIGWHEIDHPLRSSLIAASVVSALAVLGLLAEQLPALPSPASLLPASAPPEVEAARGPIPELPREWQYEIKPVDVEAMYVRRAQAPSVDQMHRTRH